MYKKCRGMTGPRKGGCPRGDYIEPLVKITVSPNTPSPEPEPHEDSDGAIISAYSKAGIVAGAGTSYSSSGGSGSSRSKNHHYITNKKAKGAKGESSVSSVSVVEGKSHSYSQPWSDLNFCSQSIPVCIDFGIQDYLCRADEAELDMSSDTDTSYLGATPPHRFSDGEIDPIEAMPVLLDTQLNIKDDNCSALLAISPGVQSQSASSIMSSTSSSGTKTDTEGDEREGQQDSNQDIPLKPTFSWRETNFQKFLARSLSKESLLSLHISSSTPMTAMDEPPPGTAPAATSHLLSLNKLRTLKDKEAHSHYHQRTGLARPFRRNISLPATIFKSYLIEIEQSNNNNQSSDQRLFKRKFSEHSPPISNFPIGTGTGTGDNPIVSNSNPNPNSSFAISTMKGKTVGARLDKIDSISNSSQVNLCDQEQNEDQDEDANNDKSLEDSRSDSCTASMERTSSDLQEDTEDAGSSWNISNSIDSDLDDQEDQPFTSELEKRSLIIRHMRRLIRQDTSGNFAPPDYHI